ncbi:hypothetical protein IV203_030108 [Nitzschia inconspicua]|uniref:Uncharacterized protein n=1 Tax=Nitzschia inconspicua TaxID=303405 RepID=A0A9K3Q101_9STRA|nr:hypothetical protein IV203_030108 [Nitzschia inconspicua]
MVASFGSRVAAAVRQRPVLFNGLTGGVLCAGSDGATQHYEAQWKHQWDNTMCDFDNFVSDREADSDPLTTTTSSTDSLLAPSPLVRTTPTSLLEKPFEKGIVGQERPKETFDLKRFFAAGAIGVFFGGLVYPFAYAKLDAVWAGTALATITKKSIIEIATVGIFVNSFSMTSRGLCRGDKEASTVALHVAQELPTVTRNDFLVWFPYNMLAFSVIPTYIRPISTLFMEASWQAYISFRSHDFDNS